MVASLGSSPLSPRIYKESQEITRALIFCGGVGGALAGDGFYWEGEGGVGARRGNAEGEGGGARRIFNLHLYYLRNKFKKLNE